MTVSVGDIVARINAEIAAKIAVGGDWGPPQFDPSIPEYVVSPANGGSDISGLDTILSFARYGNYSGAAYGAGKYSARLAFDDYHPGDPNAAANLQSRIASYLANDAESPQLKVKDGFDEHGRLHDLLYQEANLAAAQKWLSVLQGNSTQTLDQIKSDETVAYREADLWWVQTQGEARYQAATPYGTALNQIGTFIFAVESSTYFGLDQPGAILQTVTAAFGGNLTPNPGGGFTAQLTYPQHGNAPSLTFYLNPDGSFNTSLNNLEGNGDWSSVNASFAVSGKLKGTTEYDTNGNYVDTTFALADDFLRAASSTYDGLHRLLHTLDINADGSSVAGYYDAAHLGILAARKLLAADGSGSILTGAGVTLTFGADNTASVKIGENGNVVANVAVKGGPVGVSAQIDLSADDLSASIGGAHFTYALDGVQISADATGKLEFRSPLGGFGEAKLTVGPDGTAAFVVGADKLSFDAGLLKSASYQNGAFTFGFASKALGFKADVNWNPTTGIAKLDMTNAEGGTFTSSLGRIDPGNTLTVGADAVSLVNAAGKVLNSTQIYADGSQDDASYDLGNLFWNYGIYHYDPAGLLGGVTWVNDDATAVSTVFNTLTGNKAFRSIVDGAGNTVQEFYDITTGALLRSATYDSLGKFVGEIVSPGIAAEQFITSTLESLAGQVVARFLITNNLPASKATEALAHVVQQAVTDELAGRVVTFASIEKAFAGSLTDIVGGFFGPEQFTELFETLGLPVELSTIAGNVLGAVATQELTAFIAKNFLNVTDIPDTLLNGTLSFDDFVANLGTAFESVGLARVGSALAEALFPQGQYAQIGESIGGAIGAVFGGFGSFFGTIAGDIIGNIFDLIFGGGRGTPLGAARFMMSDGHAVFLDSASDNDGHREVGEQLVSAAISTLNPIFDAVGGHASNNQIWTLGYVGSQFYSEPPEVSGIPGWTRFDDPKAALENAVMSFLRHTQFSGGDPFMMAVITKDSALGLSQMIDDLNVAHDYSLYVKDPLAFDVSIARASDPAQLQHWLSELARARQLGLDKLQGAGLPTTGPVDLHGTAGDDTLAGGSGNDTLAGADGNDALVGNFGTDTAVFTGLHTNYIVAYDAVAQSFTVTDTRVGSPDGSDTTSDIEQFQFADGLFVYDHAGRVTSQTVTQGDGSKTVSLFDAAGAAPWASQTLAFDSQGSLASETVGTDGGARWVNGYDTQGVAAWLWQTGDYDAAGHLLTQAGTNDDGTHWLTLYDVAHAYGFASATIAFDAGWMATGVTGTNDDGTHAIPQDEVWMAFDTALWFASPYDANFGSAAADLVVNGGSGIDVLYGRNGNDRLNAGAGNDVLAGGGGEDLLTGGPGNDRFIVTSHDGFDTISDFAPGDANGDVLDLRGDGLADFAAVQALMTQMGDDTVIALDAYNHIVLQNVLMSQLNQGDFLLA